MEGELIMSFINTTDDKLKNYEVSGDYKFIIHKMIEGGSGRAQGSFKGKVQDGKFNAFMHGNGSDNNYRSVRFTCVLDGSLSKSKGFGTYKITTDYRSYDGKWHAENENAK